MGYSRDIHWPWAPVIAGSGLIMLSIVMRMYEFDNAFVNLVSSAGDIIVVFSLLYIIKLFIIDDNLMPTLTTYQAGHVDIVRAVPAQTKMYVPSVTEETSRRSSVADLVDQLQFSITSVNERTGTIGVQANITAEQLQPLDLKKGMLELMKQQLEIKLRIKSWATQQHGSEFEIKNISNLVIERTEHGVQIKTTYMLGH